MLTETQNPNTLNLDQMDSLSIVTAMNQEDQTVPLAIEKALPHIAQAVDTIRDCLAAGGRLLYIGAGTSGRLGVIDAVECVPTFGTPHETVQGIIAGGDGAIVKSIEGAEDDADAGADDLKARDLSAQDVVVGIAASGRTPYVLGAISYAKSIGAKTIGISCNDPAPLLEAADIPIGLVVGAEVLTGSTRLKAGTAQKLVANMLSTAAFAQLGKVYGNLMVDVQVTNQKLEQRAQRIIREVTGVDEPKSAELLTAAQNNVKAAIVMHAKQVDYDAAQELLNESNGHLRPIIGSSED